MYLDDEIKILRKYQDGKDLDDMDRSIVDELCGMGLMRRGINIRRMKLTVKTTKLGSKLL